MRLTARHRFPDHTEQATVGGVNLSPCMHSTALPPPHPQVSPPRGLSSASQGRQGGLRGSCWWTSGGKALALWARHKCKQYGQLTCGPQNL